MAVRQNENGQSYVDAGFGANIPGMKAKPVAHEVQAKTRKNLEKSGHPVKGYGELSRFIRIINRAEMGPCTGRAFLGCFEGQSWPEEHDGEDESTWLQPGTYMDVPKDVALHLVGNVWDPTLPDKQHIISRYGGPQYKAPPGDSVSGRGAPMQIIGPPAIPDLIVVEVNSRGKMEESFKYVYELYTKGLIGTELKIGADALAEEPEAKIESVGPARAKQLVTA